MVEIDEKAPGEPITQKSADVPVERGNFCTACGTKNTADANFCKSCGKRTDRHITPQFSEEEFALPASESERVEALLIEALHSSHLGDLDGAVAACGTVLRLRPDSTDAHSLMSTLHEKRGEIDLAIKERERVLQLNPGSIADREKLDHLRDGVRSGPTPKIHSLHRSPSHSIFDSPGGAALVAVTVFLIVFVVWAAANYFRSPQAKANPTGIASGILPAQPFQGAVQPSAGPGPGPSVPSPSGSGGFLNKPPQAMASELQNRSRPPAGDTSAMRPNDVQIPPAPIMTERPPNMESDAQFRPGANSNPNTFILPDRNPQDNGTSNTNSVPSGAGTVRPGPRDVGKIDIVVSSDPINRNNSAAQGGTATQGGNSGSAQTPPANSNQESKSRRAVALQQQLQGNYQRAIVEYKKSLDGAGDEAASTHQQIALCYQRLDDKENAMAHLSDALRLYRQQQEAGRNAEAAAQGIRACEAAIRVLK